MGKHGEGSIALRADGYWRVSLQRNGRRLQRSARTREEAEARLALLRQRSFRGSTDGIRAKQRRLRAEDWIKRVLDEGTAQGWTNAYIARVLSCQLAPSRVKRDIFGPCAYCGTWLAGTVDHVVPRTMGGTDDPENLTSACGSCNSRKFNRSADSMSTSMSDPRSPHVPPETTRFEDDSHHRMTRTPGQGA